MFIEVRALTDAERADYLGWLCEEWGSVQIERLDELVDATDLPALVAEHEGEILGFAALINAEDHVEVLALKSFRQYCGVGSLLMQQSEQAARDRGVNEVRLFTTNDNLHAQRFYHKLGYRLVAVHPDTITRARELLKPSIPLYGNDGIVIADELEFRKRV
ncbi:MAG TPA: GNAT family N-acetyltransferase [Fimbriimonas sp.]|nr:GNAT family N-acetyltransferase [Fimbriimonas sp.]